MLSPASLLLRRALVLALLVAPTFSSAQEVSALSTTAPYQCKRLTDPSNKFVSALKLLFAATGDDESSSDGGSSLSLLSDPSVFGPIDKLAPELSQCISEVDPMLVISSLMASPKALQCWQQIDAFDLSASPVPGAISPTYYKDSMCPQYKTTIVPCVTEVLLPALETAFSQSNGCCDPFQKQAVNSFGGSMTKTATKLLQLIGNALCSVKSSSTNANAPAVMCGDSLEANWLKHTEGEDEAAFVSMLTAFQIPNDQACKAANSQPFTTTTGVQAQFGFKDVAPYGICYTPADALVSYVRSWPMWSAAISGQSTATVTQNLLGDKRCARGGDVVKWVVDESGPVMKTARIVDDLMSVLGVAVSGAGGDEPTTPTLTPSVTPAPSSGDGSAATPEPTTPEPATPEPTTPEPTTPEPTTPEPTTPEPTTPEPTTPEPTTPEPTTPEPTTPEPTTPEPTTPEPTTPEPTTPEPTTPEPTTPEPTTSEPSSAVGSDSGSVDLFDADSGSGSGIDSGISLESLSFELEAMPLQVHAGEDEATPEPTSAPFQVTKHSVVHAFHKMLFHNHHGRALAESSSASNLTLAESIQGMASQLTSLVGNMCFHIPNGVQCSFSGQWLEEPYPQGAFNPAGEDDPTPTPTPSKPSTTTPTTTAPTTSNSTSVAPYSRTQGSTSVVAVAASFAVLLVQLL